MAPLYRHALDFVWYLNNNNGRFSRFSYRENNTFRKVFWCDLLFCWSI